jgi:hypothetical protein
VNATVRHGRSAWNVEEQGPLRPNDLARMATNEHLDAPFGTKTGP